MRKRWCFLFLGLLVVCAFSGCKTYADRIAEYRLSFANGNMEKAESIIGEMEADYADADDARDALVVLLEAANTARVGGDLALSRQRFARAENIYEAWQQKAAISVTGEGLALFTNPTTLPYRGTGADILMINLYQTLNALQCGDIAGARQPLMRLDSHQKAVVSANAERIAKSREAVAKSEHASAINSATRDPKTAAATNAIMADLPDTRGYELYANPFAEYLFAFYHRYAGVDAADREMARFRMQRALSMAPNNAAIQRAAKELESGASIAPGVYLFHEDGMAPYREEFALTLPIYAGKTFSFVSIALPRQEHDRDCAGVARVSGGGQSASAELVCDMEAVLTQEYKNDYPGMLTRAIASATAKAAAAYAANYAARQSGDGLTQIAVLIGTAAYQIASNTADTRSWVSLPKTFGVGRIDLPADRKIKVTCGRETIPITLPSKGDVWVIYLRTMHRGGKPWVSTFRVH